MVKAWTSHGAVGFGVKAICLGNGVCHAVPGKLAQEGMVGACKELVWSRKWRQDLLKLLGAGAVHVVDNVTSRGVSLLRERC